jgi:hypothetical protein
VESPQYSNQVKELPKEEPKKEAEIKKEIPETIKKEEVGSMAGQGYFRASFDLQSRTTPVTKMETVTSGIFKTTSGWQDAKYYLLLDKVQSGTIVKLTNPENNKIVFAKVLGEMNGIRQNQGLDIRISNAAAAALEVNDLEKFILKISY